MYYSQTVNGEPSGPPSYSETEGNKAPQDGQQQAQMIVVQNGIPPLGPESVQCICPTCKASIRTQVEEKISNSAYMCCLLMCIIGLCPCSCIPFCMDSFTVYNHSCPKCRAFIGIYQQK